MPEAFFYKSKHHLQELRVRRHQKHLKSILVSSYNTHTVPTVITTTKYLTKKTQLTEVKCQEDCIFDKCWSKCMYEYWCLQQSTLKRGSITDVSVINFKSLRIVITTLHTSLHNIDQAVRTQRFPVSSTVGATSVMKEF
jgi:hypothetical protein